MSAERAQSIATPNASAARSPIKLSICLITYNRARYLEPLLEDLFRKRPFDFPFEIVLCDNHSDDRTPELVAAYRARHPEIRSVRQRSNVGHENNIASAFRLAKGEFAVYLADDDRLITEAVADIVRYMEAHPEVAVCYAGKQSWDDVNKKVVGQHYTVPEERVFRKASAVDLFNMVIQYRIFPEHCIYRTDALHRIHTIAFNAYSPFVHLAHVLDCGDVAFLPKPFYREVAVGAAPGTGDHIGVQWSISRRDSFIAGFEYLAQKAFRHLGLPGIPAGQVEALQKLIHGLNVDQMALCVKLLMTTKNYRGAYEFIVRQQSYGHADTAKVAELREFLILHASVQALIETFEGISVLEEIVLYELAQPEPLLALLRERKPDLRVRALTCAELATVAHPERALVWNGAENERDRLLAAGFMPGLVIDEGDLKRLFVL